MTPPPMTVLAETSGNAAGMIVENLAPARNQSPPALETPILTNLISGFHCDMAGAAKPRATATISTRTRVFVMADPPWPDNFSAFAPCVKRASGEARDGRGRVSGEDEDGARERAALHLVESVVDVSEREPAADELVQEHGAIEIGSRDLRKIHARPRAAVARAHDLLLAHERPEAQRDARVDGGLAEDHDDRPRPRRLEARLQRGLVAGRLEDVVRTAAAGEPADGGRDVLAARVDNVGGAEARRGGERTVVDVGGDDGARP